MAHGIVAEGIRVRVGGQPRSVVRQSLQAAGVRLNAHAETLLEHPVFDDPEGQDLWFVERTVGELGLPAGGSLSAVLAAARACGLQLCPAISGPFLRLAMLEQPNAPDSVLSAGRAPSGAIHIAAEPLRDDDSYPKGFYLRVVDGEPWLRGYRCDDAYQWGPDQRLAFAVPAPQVTAPAASTPGAKL